MDSWSRHVCLALQQRGRKRRVTWLKRCVPNQAPRNLDLAFVPLLSLPGLVASACHLFQPSGSIGTDSSLVLMISHSLQLKLPLCGAPPPRPVPGDGLLPLVLVPEGVYPSVSQSSFHFFSTQHTPLLKFVMVASPLSTLTQTACTQQAVGTPTPPQAALSGGSTISLWPTVICTS